MNNPIPSGRRSRMLKTPRMLREVIIPTRLTTETIITVMLKATGKSRASLKSM